MEGMLMMGDSTFSRMVGSDSDEPLSAAAAATGVSSSSINNF